MNFQIVRFKDSSKRRACNLKWAREANTLEGFLGAGAGQDSKQSS